MSNILSSILPSFFTGLLFLVLFFLLSLFLVVGIKSVFIAIKPYFTKKKKPKAIEIKPKESPKPKPIKKKVSRSIEINPDEVDKIYVKKVS